MTKGTRSAKPANQTTPETDHTEGAGETPPTPAADSSSMGDMGQEQSLRISVVCGSTIRGTIIGES